MLPLTLYLHLPWCVRKCPYCDFNSHEVRGELPWDDYVDAMLADFSGALAALGARKFESVFIGGGTPSLCPPATLARLLDSLFEGGRLRPGAEITLEANPGTVDQSHFRAYRAAGVNRLSLGVQSFDDACLGAIGRIHGGDGARRAAGLAAGVFENFNIDLMYGLPGQTSRSAAADVSEAASFGPTHLSCYQLALEPNTVFAKYPPRLPAEHEQAAIEARVRETLRAAGYRAYEISAHARGGGECRHNRHYWEFADYLGVGAGAHSKLTTAAGICRERRVSSPEGYMRRAGVGQAVAERRPVAIATLVAEFMMNALRLTQGFPLTLLLERAGEPPPAVWRAMARAAAWGGLASDGRWIRATPMGQRYLNRLVAEFLPD